MSFSELPRLQSVRLVRLYQLRQDDLVHVEDIEIRHLAAAALQMVQIHADLPGQHQVARGGRDSAEGVRTDEARHHGQGRVRRGLRAGRPCDQRTDDGGDTAGYVQEDQR